MNGRVSKKIHKLTTILIMSGEVEPEASRRQVVRRLKKRYAQGKLTMGMINDTLQEHWPGRM